MSSITSSRPPSRSSFDHGTRNYVPNSVRSPYSTTSPGITLTTICPPTPGVKVATQQQQGSTSSPAGYFGLVIDPRESTLSINHTKQNWSTTPSVKLVAARSPRPVSLENLHLPESFHKQAQALACSFHRPNVSNRSEAVHAPNEFFGEKSNMMASSLASSSSPPTGCVESDGESVSSPACLPHYFNGPQTASPFPMETDLLPQASDLPRLSVPTSPRPDMGQFHSAIKKSNSMPVPAKTDEMALITPEYLNDLLRTERGKVLILDLRRYPQYAQSRIKDAVHLCIPTTLLKRPSFGVAKLSETLANEADKAKFATWKNAKYIVVYDTDSKTIKDAVPAVHTVNKFVREGWEGDAYSLKGGFVAFASAFPEKIDDRPLGGSSSPKTLALTASGPKFDKVIAGAFNCRLPLQTSVCNPFFSNIRQNMDLIEGVGEIPITLPQSMSNEAKDSLPAWLKRVACEPDGSKLVSERFYNIEKAEQERMQRALNINISYGSPTKAETQKRHILAGMEQGTKNRYNNIWPYDHSRVKLKDFPKNSCDYVNASYISSPYIKRRYIATQGPLPSTFQDFWSVVWEQDVRVIVMLTAETEGGVIKCHNYWQDEHYGPLQLTKQNEYRIPLEPINPKGNNAKQRRSTTGSAKGIPPPPASNDGNIPFIIVRTFSLCHDNYPFDPIREITQLQYSSWPDFGAPAHPAHILSLIEHTDAFLRSTQRPSNSSSSGGTNKSIQHPAIVHCSAGCGRTGTFCAVDTVISMLSRKRYYKQYGRLPDTDGSGADTTNSSGADTEWLDRDDEDLICQVVSSFRDQRLSMVQSLWQFVLCYETVLEWFVRQEALTTGKTESEQRIS